MTDQDDLLPIGLEDALPERAAAITWAMRAVLDTMDSHGYDRVRPPLIEFEHSLAGRMQGVATRRMVRFTDPDSLRTLALRGDMTVQVGRIAATGLATAPRPLRLCYAGEVALVKADQLDPARQRLQMGAELMVGADFITVMAPPEGVCLRGVDCDLNGIPDMALTAAVVALFCHGPSTLRNIGNLRLKETDRLSALQNELTKLGARVEIDGDDLHIEPPPDRRLQPAAIDTYNDHRMAMSFSVAALAARTGQIVINDPDCVSKTFPDFFKYLDQLRQRV